MPAELAAVEQPRHPLYALTTYELRDYRRALEQAIACGASRTRRPQPWPACKQGLMRCSPSRNPAPSSPQTADSDSGRQARVGDQAFAPTPCGSPDCCVSTG
jgi:hypothetical protein